MRAIFSTCFLLIGLVKAGATNLPPATTLLLDDKTVIRLTAVLKEYENPPKAAGRLISAGSGTATVLVNRWVSEFAALHPEAELDIQGGGSADALAKLLNGQVDMVPMSRPLPATNITLFKAKFGYEPTQVVVAQDAIGVYVNKHNPISGLTMAQLEAIFSRDPKGGIGQPEFWGDLGVVGELANERLMRISLSRVHGTHLFLQDELLHGGDYRFSVHFEPVPSSVSQAMGSDIAAIGCSSVMFATARTRFVPLLSEDGNYLLPTYENTISGRYPLVRPMRIVFHRKPDGTMNPLVREFLRFAVSRRGQRITGLAQSYPLTLEQQEAALAVIGEEPPVKAGSHRRR